MAEAIAALNDAFRQTFLGGLVVITDGVASLPGSERATLLADVRGFGQFDAGNDPYDEHDFGAVEVEAQKFYWKIEYYDASMTAGSPDPSDPALTRRVLTIMRADEY